ncbi:MAG TPA: undecaprenyl-diphosphate phosphatase, partial [Planctomycetota bacterium]|nr:undecaprenyl-diphosphate phosphatase [Planctomycetota bacterium]
VALHVGTLVAVIAAYRRDVLRLFQDLAKGRMVMWVWLIVATLPAAVVGLVFKDRIEAAATNVSIAIGGLLVTAALLVVGESRRPKHAERSETDQDPWGRLRLSDAVVMGLAQALAIVPGISRSGSTISSAFLRGIDSYQAARLSFLMSLPAISGAAILELPHLFEEGVGELGAGWILAAMALSAVVGFFALRTLVLVLSKGAFRYFALYCTCLAGVAFWFLR